MNDALVDRIKQCPSLPSLPAIAVQVLDLAQRPDADVGAIAKLIAADPALSGKLLRTVNSSFYARPQPVGTVTQAVVILGLQSVKTLVLGFSLVTSLAGKGSGAGAKGGPGGGGAGGKPGTGGGFDRLAFWKRSLYAATAARALAAKLHVVQQEEAFLAGLLADVGMLALDRVLGDEYAAVCGPAATHDDLCAAEQVALGLTHADVGGVLAAGWKLPALLAVPVAGHHAPAAVADPQLRKLAELVYLAGRCADVYVDAEPAGSIADVRRACREQHGLTDAEADAVLAGVGAKTAEVATLFEINLGPASAADFDAILKRANEALVEMSLRSQAEASALQLQATDLTAQNERLRHQATTDGLTRLANRARFDEFLAERFATARDSGKSLSLLLLDLDKFKAVNDRFGHPTGDRVLQGVGKLLAAAARPQDLAARYGGEELVLVLPETARSTAAAIAESVRRAIAARPMPTDAGPVPVTASVGVATFEAGGPLKTPAHLTKAADLAVYAAKAAGRNCVRVFTLPAAAAGRPAA
jgi:diguanylate cyclase (GGDEF)-like protein